MRLQAVGAAKSSSEHACHGATGMVAASTIGASTALDPIVLHVLVLVHAGVAVSHDDASACARVPPVALKRLRATAQALLMQFTSSAGMARSLLTGSPEIRESESEREAGDGDGNGEDADVDVREGIAADGVAKQAPHFVACDPHIVNSYGCNSAMWAAQGASLDVCKFVWSLQVSIDFGLINENAIG